MSRPGDVPPLQPTTAEAVELNGVTVLRVRGEIDVDSGTRLEAALRDCLDRRPSCLVIDLSGVHFFGAAGITFLVDAQSRAAELGAFLCVVADHRRVLRPLRLTGQDADIPVFPRMADAVARARRSDVPSGDREIAM